MSELAKMLVAPVAPAIDEVQRWIGHSPHPAVVALPLGCWTFSTFCDSLGMLVGGRAYDDAARLSMGVGLVGATVAAVTGLRDYSKIPEDRPSHEVATTHALGNVLATALLAASFAMRSRDHQTGRPVSLAARALGLAGGGVSAYTAWLGGVLVANYGEGVEALGHEESARGRARLNPDAPLGEHPGDSAEL